MTAESSQPPIATSSDNTVLQLFPPKLLGSTIPVVGAHCGAPIHLMDLPSMGALVLVTAYLGQAPNDTIRIFVNGVLNTAFAHTETESSDTKIYLQVHDLKPNIVNLMTYTVIRNSENKGTSEPPLEILYNDIRPGNQDMTPGPPHEHSRLELLLPDAIKNGVGPDFPVAGVQVCVRYPYCRAYDLIRLNCNGYDVFHTVTPSQAPPRGSDTPVTVCFTVTRADLEAAKDNPLFVFSFTVTDQVGNSPDTDAPWSARHIVDVDLAGTRLPAPILREIQNDPTDDPGIIDLEKLGTNPLLLIVVTSDPRFAPGDTLSATYTAKITGQPDVVVTATGVIEVDEFGQKKPCVLQVANDNVIAGSVVTVTYQLFKGGTPAGTSKVATARVVGENTIELSPPTLPSAPNPFDPLNYPQGVSVRVDYAGAVPGDKARLFLLNPPPGSPAFVDLPLDQKFAVFILDAIFLGLWHGKVPQLAWKLIKGELPVAESKPLVVTVNRIANDDPRLPTPTIDGATGDGVLDVAQMQDTAQLRVAAWLLQVSGHCIWLRYEGVDNQDLATEKVVWAGAPHASTSGLITVAAIAWLKTLKDGSRLTLTFGVNFAKQADAATMVRFPVQVYTVRAIELVVPVIDSIKDSANNEIPRGGTTVDTAVTLSGTANKGLKVQVRDDDTSKGEVTADLITGIWTLLVTGLSVADHSFTAKALYGNNEVSAPYTFSVVQVLEVDQTEMRLDGEKLVQDLGWEASEVAGNTAIRTARGGKKPYTYTAVDPRVVSVDSNGKVSGLKNGVTSIQIRDSANQSISYAVRVSNVSRILRSESLMTPREAKVWMISAGTLRYRDQASFSNGFRKNFRDLSITLNGSYIMLDLSSSMGFEVIFFLGDLVFYPLNFSEVDGSPLIATTVITT